MDKFQDKFRRLIGSNRQSEGSESQDAFGRFHSSTSGTSQSESVNIPGAPDSEDIRDTAKRFRVLVIGRANAGKTTILQRVCNTVDRPEIFDSNGKKIKKSILGPSVNRGMHHIENELVFKSNPGFVFHDSRGFEAGSIGELDKVKEFITKRSKMTDLRNQLHVIWYCIPMDDERPFTAAERSFFSECGTGSVPVVAIFTKFDALEDVAYAKLRNEGVVHNNAVKQTADRVVADFERDYLPVLDELKYPPKGHVYLRDMNKPTADCRRLTETVAAVLDCTILQRLFVSTQQNNLELCIQFALREFGGAILNIKQQSTAMCMELQIEMTQWFPHFYRRDDDLDLDDLDDDLLQQRLGLPVRQGGGPVLRGRVGGPLLQLLDQDQLFQLRIWPSQITDHQFQANINLFISSPPGLYQIAQLGVAFAIILEHSFYLWHQAPSDNLKFLTSALDCYKSSGKHETVIAGIDRIFKGEEGLPFENALGSADPRQSVFAQQLIQIALDNRLTPP